VRVSLTHSFFNSVYRIPAILIYQSLVGTLLMKWKPPEDATLASYAIMRCAKLKTAGGVASSLKHNFREQETLNADPARYDENQHIVAESVSEAMGNMRSRLPERVRKDAVLAVEYLMTTSPEWAQSASESQQRLFFEKSLKWLEDKYGAENVIAATVHNDETTPHMAAYVVPITADGRLSAKEFIGNRSQMSADQTSFADAVKDLGLERGIKRSKATHESIRSYYQRVNRIERAQVRSEAVASIEKDLAPRVVEKGLLTSKKETREQVAQRVYKAHVEPLTRKVATLAKELDSYREKTAKLAKHAALKPNNVNLDEAGVWLEKLSDLKRDRYVNHGQKTEIKREGKVTKSERTQRRR